MKLLHCADLHLDSPMRGLARYEDAPVESLRGATRAAFEAAVGLAVDEQMAAVVISGDLYDGNRDDYQTAVFLQRQFHRLREAGIPVVVGYGNHDAESEITRRLVLPDNVRVLPAAAAGTVVLEDAGLAIHGRSYATRVVDEDLSASYPAPVPGLANVGVLHTSLEGRPGHARYAPCTLDALLRRGYEYWALGHVHQREQHDRDGVTVVFPGNLCGRDVGEAGPKGATVVEYDGDAVTSATHAELAPVRWHRVRVGAQRAATAPEVIEAVLEDLDGVRASAPRALHAVRVLAVLEPRAVGQWWRDAEQFEAQLRADAAGADGAVWLERVEVRSAAGAAAVPGEAMAAIGDTLEALRAGDGGGQVLAGLLAGVRARFGAELSSAVQLGALLEDDAADRLFADAEALLAAELGGA